MLSDFRALGAVAGWQCTNPRIFEQPEPISEAWGQVADWLACESAWIPQPGERHAEILASLLADPGVRANLVPL